MTHDESKCLSTRAITGIAVDAVVVVIVEGFVLLRVGRRKIKRPAGHEVWKKDGEVVFGYRRHQKKEPEAQELFSEDRHELHGQQLRYQLMSRPIYALDGHHDAHELYTDPKG